MIHALLSPTAALLVLLAAPQAATPPASTQPPASPAQPGSVKQLEEHNRKVAEDAARCPIKAEPPMKDFGFVAPNTQLDWTAKINNPLNESVKCILSKPSCTCTTVDMVGKVIPAGESITVPVSMKTSGATGSKTATVQMIFQRASGEVVPGAVELRLRAEVVYAIRAYQVNPQAGGATGMDPFVNAFDFPAQEKGTVVVESLDGKPFNVLTVMGKPASGTPMNAERSKLSVPYDFSALSCADKPKWLVIETDRPDAPLVEMRVRHACTGIKPAFGYAQYYENLGVLEQGKEQTFIIQINHCNGVRVDSVTSQDPRLQVKLVETSTVADTLYAKVSVVAQPGMEGVFVLPVTVAGVGPDPKMPAPPGSVPAGVTARAGPYYLVFKSVPAGSAQPGAATAPPASP
jgi:hypothetical protein